MYDPWTWTKGGECGWEGCAGWRGIKGGKWDNSNSVINKYILKNCYGKSWFDKTQHIDILVRMSLNVIVFKVEIKFISIYICPKVRKIKIFDVGCTVDNIPISHHQMHYLSQGVLSPREEVGFQNLRTWLCPLHFLFPFSVPHCLHRIVAGIESWNWSSEIRESL